MTQLIAFRAIQGLGAGGLLVGAMAIIGDLVPPRERGRYQGFMAAAMAAAMIAGPLAGGFITDNLSWRWAFYINIPLGAIALFLIVTQLHLPKHRTEHRIDWLGAGLLAVGITSLVLITTWGGNQYAVGLRADPRPGRHRGGHPRPVHAGRTAGRRADPVARAVPQPQLHPQRADRLPARLRDVRRDQLPAALPAGRPGRLGHQLRPAAAADDGRHAGGLAGRRAGHHQDRALQVVPGDRWRDHDGLAVPAGNRLGRHQQDSPSR